MNIRYSECFSSFQGEAQFTGMPSIWFRFFGCNLSCPRFGHTSDNPADWTQTIQQIDVSKLNYMDEVPLLETGCDSGYSWSSRFKHLAYTQNEKSIAEQMVVMAKEKLGVTNWIHPVTKKPAQLCFTGGEPMMQQRAMASITRELVALNGNGAIPQITIETNGTKKIEAAPFADLSEYVKHIHFAISPKLYAVSGERNVVKRDIIESYCKAGATTAMKFVVDGSDECWRELEQHEHWLRDLPNTSLWLMPCGATKEQQTGEYVANLAEEIMLRGYQVAARVHTYLFSNKMGT